MPQNWQHLGALAGAVPSAAPSELAAGAAADISPAAAAARVATDAGAAVKDATETW
jgi:hypothetical protein